MGSKGKEKISEGVDGQLRGPEVQFTVIAPECLPMARSISMSLQPLAAFSPSTFLKGYKLQGDNNVYSGLPRKHILSQGL